MTREEIIDFCDMKAQLEPENEDIYKEIVKMLEQEPILDRVRAEIQDIAFDWQEIDGEHESFMVVDLNDALNIIDKYKAKSEELTMSSIKNIIIEAANRRDLTFAQNFNGRAYALMDANWIGYFDTLDEVLEYLGISVEKDKAESEN